MVCMRVILLVLKAAVVEHKLNMKVPFFILAMALMILMTVFVIEITSIYEQDDEIEIVHQVVRDGTWVDTIRPYKLLEKKHFWILP